MLSNEMKRLKVVLRQFVQQLLDLEHALRLILDVVGRDHQLVEFCTTVIHTVIINSRNSLTAVTVQCLSCKRPN